MAGSIIGPYTLPSGKKTDNYCTYYNAWHQWSDKLEKRLLVKVRQVDPDFLVEDTKNPGRVFNIPTWLAERIVMPKKPRRRKVK